MGNILQMRSFDHRTYKIDCNHIFYTEAHFYLILIFETIYALFLIFFVKPLASIFNKSFLIQNLLFGIFIHYKMANLDTITNKNNKKWLYIPDHRYRILIINGSGSGETTALINLTNEQHDIDKTYLYASDLNETKHQVLIKRREDAGIKHVNNPNAFIECLRILTIS